MLILYVRLTVITKVFKIDYKWVDTPSWWQSRCKIKPTVFFSFHSFRTSANVFQSLITYLPCPFLKCFCYARYMLCVLHTQYYFICLHFLLVAMINTTTQTAFVEGRVCLAYRLQSTTEESQGRNQSRGTVLPGSLNNFLIQPRTLPTHA